jgi:hypothetical protein
MDSVNSYIAALVLAYGLLYMTRNQLSSGSAYLFDIGVLKPVHFAAMETSRSAAVFASRFGAGFVLKRMGMHSVALGFVASGLLMFGAYVVLGAAAVLRAAPKTLTGILITAFCFIKLLSSTAKILVYAIASKLLSARDTHTQQSVMSRLSIALQVASNVGDAIGKVSFGSFLKSKAFVLAPRWGYAMLFTSLADLVAAAVSLPHWFNIAPPPKIISVGAFRSESPISAPAPPTKFRVSIRFVLVLVIGGLNSVVGTIIGSYMTIYMRYALGIDSAEVAQFDAITPVLNIVTILLFGHLVQLSIHNRHRLLYTVVLPGLLSLAAAGVVYSATESRHVATALVALFAHHAFFCPYQTIIDGSYLMLITHPANAAIAVGISSGAGYLVSIAIPFTIVQYTTSHAGWMLLLRCIIGFKVAAFVPLAFLYCLDARRKLS